MVVKLVKLAVLSGLLLCFGFMSLRANDDETNVKSVAMDYVLGFYTGQADLLDKALSPELKKLGWYRSSSGDAYAGPYYMPKDEALSFAPPYAEREKIPEDAIKNVFILDLLDKIASVKVEAVWGIDYIHMAKTGDGWKIYNVIWQSWPDGMERK